MNLIATQQRIPMTSHKITRSVNHINPPTALVVMSGRVKNETEVEVSVSPVLWIRLSQERYYEHHDENADKLATHRELIKAGWIYEGEYEEQSFAYLSFDPVISYYNENDDFFKSVIVCCPDEVDENRDYIIEESFKEHRRLQEQQAKWKKSQNNATAKEHAKTY